MWGVASVVRAGSRCEECPRRRAGDGNPVKARSPDDEEEDSVADTEFPS